jgi:uncharacterized protein YkwD
VPEMNAERLHAVTAVARASGSAPRCLVRLSLFIGFALLLPGGCPTMQAVQEIGFDLTRPVVYGPASTVGRVSTPYSAPVSPSLNLTAGSAAQGGATAFEADLAVQFPGCADPANGQEFEAEILRLVNRERTARGLNALVRSAVLEFQATQYACEMIEYAFFDHVNPQTGSRLRDRAEQFGYHYQAIGENLAAGQPTPARAMQDWMNSPGHRDNILNPDYTELGVAYRLGGSYTHYWVQEFGRPAPPASLSAPPLAGATAVGQR